MDKSKRVQYTRRARIFTGTGCNARCRFCYYYLTGLHDFWPKEKVISEINIAKRAGMRAIDFSGGEPTIHPNFLEFVKYAKSKGFEVICALTNGLRMENKDFVKKMVEAGINDVLFSVHGHNSEEHDYITQIPGSFEKIIQAIENFKEYDISFRVNCTVTNINYKNLDKHTKLYKKLGPRQVNFILFNDFELAKELTDQFAVKYSEAGQYIKKAIDILRGKIPYINVRYIPFCFMKNYEKYICDYPQKIYDPFEWSQRMLIRLPSTGITPFWKYLGYLFYGFVKSHPKFNLRKDYLEDICVSMRLRDYVKPEICKSCKFCHICQGLEISYAKIFRINELKPVKTKKKILNPLFFRKDFYAGYRYGK